MTNHECNAPSRIELQVGSMMLGVVDWGGKGPPILLLHGITSNAYAWWRVAAELREQGHHVFSLDMPGHGLSDLPRDHQLSTIAEAVCGAIAALELRNLTVIGHSWGGATALTLVTGNDPSRDVIERVVLIDPAMAMSFEWGNARIDSYLTGVGLPAEATAAGLAANNPDWHPCDVHWKAVALAECREAAVRGFFTQSGDWILAEKLASVEIPMLFLVADTHHTVIGAPVLAAAQAAASSQVQFAQIAGTTHNMFRGAGYEATLPTLLAWLAANTSS